MSSRPSNRLSIETNAASAAAAARRMLPSPMSSINSRAPFPLEEMVSTTILSHPPALSISPLPYTASDQYVQQHPYQQHVPPQPQQRQRYRSLSGSGGPQATPGTSPWGGEQDVQNPVMSRRPSLPVNQHQMYQQHRHQHSQQYQNNYAQRQYHSAHPSSYSHQRELLMSRDQQHQELPLTPSTPSSIAPVVRHPLWRLECSSCNTTLCEQAMQGHLVGDPSKKLFSTNLATGVLGLPDRPVSIICPCKFHLFACASCGSVCGYNLSQPCTGCETNRGNGHFWIFYAHEIIPYWRTIGDRNMFWDDLPPWNNKIDGNVGR
ncbi:FAM72 protein-domain-containing protein [Gamsiella multidivaricata]|uniref:FAM72 protein-domain-containing protein n=1 Tax=Gamsiella multidivaricata TaxID=101098 RepID=UPI00221F6221|nr:FAM72 protein-domain-containing protein [Gamsiella multidivaricata]KAI7831697.1 FAM72 protein-domain-containing protein [Gamsiella multidivaricata]